MATLTSILTSDLISTGPAAINFNDNALNLDIFSAQSSIVSLQSSVTAVTSSVASQGAWTTWTPSWSGGISAIGNATIVARYTQIGKFLSGHIEVTFGNTTSFTSGNIIFTLPVTINGVNPAYMGTALVQDASPAANYLGFVSSNSATTGKFLVAVTSSSFATETTVSNTAPFTFTTNDVIIGNFNYEI